MRGGWLVVGVASVVVAAPRAMADPEAPVRLTYAAPASCPDAATFEAAVRQRAPRATITATAPRVFAIAITTGDAGFTGTLSTGDAGATRALAASRCDDLIAALALVTALAIDPSVALGAPDPPAPAPPPPAPPPPVPPPPVPPPAPRPRWSGWGAATLAIAHGVAPDPLPTAGLEARLARVGLGHVALGAAAGRQTVTTAAGRATFTWVIARASGCWTAIDRAIALDACGHAEVGALGARGLDIVRAREVTRTWLAVGAHAALRWSPGAWLFVEAQAGASLPIVRDRFVFTPNQLIHQADAVVPWTAIGVGLRLP